MRIVGIDPGLNVTGYGVIEAADGPIRVMDAGDIRPPARRPLADRLAYLHDGLSTIFSRYHPDTAVLEKVFTHHRYPNTAALMAHARGVACLVVQEHGAALAEYAPAQIKKSLTGSGAASKDQVGRMVGQWVRGVDPSWSSDATDALALAIVHAHRRTLPAGVA